MARRTRKPVKYAVVDAFAESEFKGNPAAVCLLEEEREDEWLQSLATEFNISETCYLTRIPASDSPQADRFQLRWFTPVAEVKLCGHATLAAAHFCFTSGLVNGDTIEFTTLSGILTAQKVPQSKTSGSPNCENVESEEPFLIELDFPAIASTDCNSSETSLLSKALSDVPVVDVKKTTGNDLFVVLPSAKDVTDLQPQLEEIKKCPGRGLIVSAVAPPESGFDFFSRFFCPKLGINEDPVCGSAHCALALYWYKQLGKSDFLAYAVFFISPFLFPLPTSFSSVVTPTVCNCVLYRTIDDTLRGQASPRGGVVKLQLNEKTNRVKLQGKAVTVMEGSVVV